MPKIQRLRKIKPFYSKQPLHYLQSHLDEEFEDFMVEMILTVSHMRAIKTNRLKGQRSLT